MFERLCARSSCVNVRSFVSVIHRNPGLQLRSCCLTAQQPARASIANMPSPGRHHEVVDLTESPSNSRRDRFVVEDDEDEDLKLAIAMSLSQQVASDGVSDAACEPIAALEDVNAKAEPLTLPVKQIGGTYGGLAGFIGIDRKAMEAERLARLKRKREDGDNTATTKIRSVSPQKQKERSVSPPPLRRAPAKQTPMVSRPDSTATISEPVNARSSSSSSEPQPQLYPDGKVLKTYVPGYPSEGTTSLPSLLSPTSTLRSALLSSFIYDFDFLFPHFNTKTTNFLLVMHAKYPNQRRIIEQDFAGIPNIRLCFPPMEGQVNCMHSKLMLLFWDDRCRVIVPTGNLRGHDWRVGAVMENMVFVIDLPVLAKDATGQETGFQRNLKQFLEAQTVPQEVSRKLDMYDFGKTENIGFVSGIGGMHEGESWRETGLCGLSRTVKELGLDTDEAIDVDFVTSSVGSLNDEFLRSMYLAAQGDDGLTELTLRNAKTFPAKRIGSKAGVKDLVQRTAGVHGEDLFRFYFPSQQVVEASNGGPDSAGTICFNERWWTGSKFPRHAMRECVSVRKRLLMHSKVSEARGLLV